MGEKLTSTKELYGLRAIDARNGKRIGKVRRFVFHPTEKRVIGFLVKRPDAALMFHRKDLFVALGGYKLEDGQVVVSEDSAATGKGAIRALGVDWNSCVIWVGMPILTESGELLGYVDEVSFAPSTGKVGGIEVGSGAANAAILGRRVIPGKMVKGFRLGRGEALVSAGAYHGEDASEADPSQMGAIMVSDAAADLSAEGGAAEAAGKATAVITDKAKKGAGKARVVVNRGAEAAKPKARKVAARAGDAVETGAYAAGKQLGKATGMFAAFKEEFDKAAHGEEDAEAPSKGSAKKGGEGK